MKYDKKDKKAKGTKKVDYTKYKALSVLNWMMQKITSIK